MRPAGRHYNLSRRVYPMDSVPRASQYWRKSNLESFLGAASFMYAVISRRAASFRSSGASTSSVTGGAGNLLVQVRSDIVHPVDMAGGAPASAPMPPEPHPRAFGACLFSYLGASRALDISAATGPVPMLPALKVSLPLKLKNLYSTGARTSFWRPFFPPFKQQTTVKRNLKRGSSSKKIFSTSSRARPSQPPFLKVLHQNLHHQSVVDPILQ